MKCPTVVVFPIAADSYSIELHAVTPWFSYPYMYMLLHKPVSFSLKRLCPTVILMMDSCQMCIGIIAIGRLSIDFDGMYSMLKKRHL